MINFGTAGTSESFKEMGFKNYKDMPQYLSKFALNSFEYQCGNGIRLKDETAVAIGNVYRENNINLSLHAPYYISMSSVEKEKRDNSVNYILQSARVADLMGATRVIVHTGSCKNMDRSEAVILTKETMLKSLKALDENGLGHIHICPETMGKINQLGTLDEVLDICTIDERLIPCIDFGHLNARTFGGIKTKQDYIEIIEKIETVLGLERAKVFHSHFSKIEYTLNGGEKRHLTFEDKEFGPNFEDLMEVISKKNLSPTIICESAGTQAEDAQTMKIYYDKLRG